MGVIMYKNNRYAGGGSADPSLHFDWSHQTLPQTGDTNTIYCIPTGDTSDPWDFYAWNDTDEEFVKIDFNMTISIDSALSDTSTNPVQNRVVKGAIDAKADNTQTFTEASTRANIASGETFAVILGKIKKFFTDLKAVAFSGSYNDLSDQPTIPAAQVNSDWNASSGVAQILNKPSSMPASDVYAWAKAATKPSYTASEVGALASDGTAVKATADADGNTISSTYMKQGVDYVTAGKKANTTLGYKATAEGQTTTASGRIAHAEGSTTTASGDYSHSEGLSTTASGQSAHAEGSLTEATASRAHAEGVGTKASSKDQHVEGKWNVEDTNDTYAHIIGGGTANNARKNIFTVDWDGVVRDGTQNRLMPYKAVSEAEYAALSQAEKTNGTAYFRYEATGVMRQIQDNGSATSLTSGALPTGQTITSYLNSNLQYIYATSFSGVLSKLNAISGVAIFRVSGSSNTDMPTTNNNHLGIIYANVAHTWGFCMCQTFGTNIYTRAILGGSWSAWRTI